MPNKRNNFDKVDTAIGGGRGSDAPAPGRGRKILKVILAIVIVIAAVFAALLVWLSVTEYKPAARETIRVTGTSSKPVREGESLTYMTWNTGYGALGDNASFFMDGGDDVQTASEKRVRSNMKGISDEIAGEKPDFVFLQEVDTDSARSYGIDEAAFLRSSYPGVQSAAFAYNFKVKFIPYPIPPIGRVNSGILTISNREITSADRYRLPCPFKWPTRLGNLKRCITVSRTPVVDSHGRKTGRELVSVNLHLEAYDSGEGKIKQTKRFRNIIQREADKGNYVIAGGDFNQTFSGTDSSMYPEHKGTWHCGKLDQEWFSPEWSFLMDNSHPTCRSLDRAYKGADHENFQYYMIDGFIVSSNVKVKSVETKDLGFKYTDHEPVVMKVELEK
jgi:endonuclease/exonuclease/phosphatase family metal-dependent hydrolase